MCNNRLGFWKKKMLSVAIAGIFMLGITGNNDIVRAADVSESSAAVAEAQQHTTSLSLVENLKMYAGGSRDNGIALMSMFEEEVTGVTASMPSTGEVKLLIFAVDFADAAFDGDIEATLEKNFFDEANEESTGEYHAYPQESLNAFYGRSSFGKLSFDGDIMTYTSEHERSYYNDNMDPLIEEIIAAFKERVIDESGLTGDAATVYLNEYLKRYDANGDYILDGVYIHYAGGTGSWGEQWWSYVGYYNGYTIGDYTFGSTCILGECEPYVLIHETGHMLGLDDYYDYDKQGSIMSGAFSMDVMQVNIGDHNVFSKLLLGWIEPENVKIISGDIETVTLPECSEAGDCVIIIPDYDETVGLYTQFYIAAYREFTGNNKVPGREIIEGGVCVYYVNATLNSSGTDFLYSNTHAISGGTIPFIRQIHPDGHEMHTELTSTEINNRAYPWPWLNALEGDFDSHNCFYGSGDELTPYTLPSSSFYKGEAQNEGREYTGITITDISISDGVATFSAGIEASAQEYEVTYTMVDSNSLPVDIFSVDNALLFSTDVTMPGGTNSGSYYYIDGGAVITDENGDTVGSLTINLVKNCNGFVYLNDKWNVADRLEYHKNYTVTIPEGTFYDSCGNSVGEIQIEYVKHNWDEGEVTKEATCAERGTMMYKCSDCDVTRTEVVLKKHHTYEYSYEHDKYCRIQLCTECGYIYVVHAEHSLGESGKRVEKEATCTEIGEIWGDCKNCWEAFFIEYIPMTEHVYDNMVVSEEYLKAEATATTRAEYYYSCDCGEAGTESFEYVANGDVDGDGEVTDVDAILLNRYLAGWTITNIKINAADVDGDGEVTDVDGIILDRYLAGWNVQIGN